MVPVPAAECERGVCAACGFLPLDLPAPRA